MNLVGGHPYLIRCALYHLARAEITWTEFLATAATDGGIYQDHLHRHLRSLQQHSDLEMALKQVLDSSSPVTLEQIQGFKLHSMGLVNLDGNQVTVSCSLYREYFCDRLSVTTN